jgi:hypothetical protein
VIGYFKTFLSSPILSLSLFSISVLIFSFPIANEKTDNLTIFTPDSRPYGLTFGEWTAKWWQWFVSIPNDANHPLNDAKGCPARNQAGPVWFLAGSITGYAERTCTIPQGKAILQPTLTQECSPAEQRSLKTESELRNCAVSSASHFRNIEVTIDGVKVKDMQRYNAVSPLFNVTFPENPVLAATPGPSQAVAAGNYLFLGPLSVGTHEIHRKGESVDFTGAATQNFAQDITYHIIVK